VDSTNKLNLSDQYADGAITAASIGAGAIDGASINLSSISSYHLAQSAKVAGGESNQRVPAELSDVKYWTDVVGKLTELHLQGYHNNEDIQNVQATPEGLLFTPTDVEARIYLTGRLPIPASRKIYTKFEADSSTQLRVIYWKYSNTIDISTTVTENGVATVTTDLPHPWKIYDKIRITGLGTDYNGFHVISAVDTNTVSFTSTSTLDIAREYWDTPGKINREDYTYEDLYSDEVWDANYREGYVTYGSMIAGVATLETVPNHPFVVGDIVTISGVDPSGWSTTGFDGTYVISAVNFDNTFSYVVDSTTYLDTDTMWGFGTMPPVMVTTKTSLSATEYSVYVEVAAYIQPVLLKSAKVFEVIGSGSKNALYTKVTSAQLVGGVATIYTAGPSYFTRDSLVVVSNVGAPFDGYHVIKSVEESSPYYWFTYKLEVADIGIPIYPPSGLGDAVSYGGTRHSELTPDGLKLYQADGSVAVNLTTAGNSVFNIYQQGEVVAAISNTGDAIFNSVDSDSITSHGNEVVGNFFEATYDGISYDSLNTYSDSYLNRLPRGVIYSGYMNPNTMVMTNSSPYLAIASGQFRLEQNRSYKISPLQGSVNINNASNKNAVIYMAIGTGPLTLGGAFDYISRFNVNAATNTQVIMPEFYVDALTLNSGIPVTGKRIRNVTATTGLVATLAANTSNVTLTTGNTSNLFSGQRLTKTAGTGVFGGVVAGEVYIDKIFNNTLFSVENVNGASANHGTAGSITFTANAITKVSIEMQSATAPPYTYNSIFGVSPATGYPYAGYWNSGYYTSVGYGANNKYEISYNLQGSAATQSTNVGSLTTSTAVDPITGSSTIQVASTHGIFPGAKLTKTSGTGSFTVGSRVNTVINATHFTTTDVVSPGGSINFNVETNLGAATDSYVYNRPMSANANANISYGTAIHWTMFMTSTPTTTTANANVTFAVDGSPNGLLSMIVEDLGVSKSLSSSVSNTYYSITDLTSTSTLRTALGSQAAKYDGSTAPTLITASVTVRADQSAYYDNYGLGDSGTSDPYANQNSIYQGNPGTASGTKKSAVRFPVLGLPSGAVVTKAEVYLRNRHSYNSGGLTAYIGAHNDGDVRNQTTPPAGINFTGTTDVVEVAFTKGQGKWVTLPSSWYASIASGTVRGILLGLTAPTNTWYSSIANYGYFDGNTQSDEPQFRVTYQYNA
jgi:hypothetical protein